MFGGILFILCELYFEIESVNTHVHTHAHIYACTHTNYLNYNIRKGIIKSY